MDLLSFEQRMTDMERRLTERMDALMAMERQRSATAIDTVVLNAQLAAMERRLSERLDAQLTQRLSQLPQAQPAPRVTERESPGEVEQIGRPSYWERLSNVQPSESD